MVETMVQKKTYSTGFLSGVSTKSTNIVDTVENYYDIALYCSSWDKRSISICSNDHLSSKFSLVILFHKKDRYGFRDKHDEIITTYAKSTSERQIYFREDSVSVELLGGKLQEAILDIFKKKGKSLKIFIDICSLPRFYLGLLMGFVFKNELVSSVTLFYAEGDYKNSGFQPNDYEFTTGRWKLIKIPMLEGNNDPYKRKFTFISVGFEGTKTLQMVDGIDPDRIAILFPDPGFSKEYTNTTKKQNSDLIKEYNIPKDNIIKAPAGNAILAWKALNEASIEKPNDENTFYLCCGTKPHSLALVLNSISKDYPTVMYRLPDGHPFADIEPNGIFWGFKINDLTSPPGL